MIPKLLLNIRMIYIYSIYKSIDGYNPQKKLETLTVFDDMIANILINKKINPVVTELFTRGRKLNISVVFIMQSYFTMLKNIRLNYTHYFIMKYPNKQQLQQYPFNHSSHIGFKDSINVYKKTYCKPYYFLVTDSALASDNSSRFSKDLLEKI